MVETRRGDRGLARFGCGRGRRRRRLGGRGHRRRGRGLLGALLAGALGLGLGLGVGLGLALVGLGLALVALFGLVERLLQIGGHQRLGQADLGLDLQGFSELLDAELALPSEMNQRAGLDGMLRQSRRVTQIQRLSQQPFGVVVLVRLVGGDSLLVELGRLGDDVGVGVLRQGRIRQGHQHGRRAKGGEKRAGK